MTKISINSPGGGGGGSGTVTSVAVTTGTTGTNVNVSGSPITTSGTITVNIPVASSTNTGKLSSTDWSTFNNKQAALVSGTNIKTINGNDLLGSGNLIVGIAGTDGQVQYNNAGVLAGASSLFYDDTNNFVGIGTTSPGAKLDVDGGSAVYTQSIRGNGVFSGMNIRNTGTQAANRGSQLTFSSGTTLIGAFDSAYNIGILNENSGAGSYFVEYWNGSTYQVRLIVLSNGNVGIGEIAAEKKLHVKDSNQCVSLFESTTTGAGISFQDATTSTNETVGVGAFGNLLCLRGGANAAGTVQISDTVVDCKGNTLRNFKAASSTLSSLTVDSNNDDVYTGTVFLCSGSSVTIDASVADGFNLSVIQSTSTQTTISVTGGLTIRNRQGHTKTAGEYATVTLLKRGSDLFLGGDTA